MKIQICFPRRNTVVSRRGYFLRLCLFLACLHLFRKFSDRSGARSSKQPLFQKLRILLFPDTFLPFPAAFHPGNRSLKPRHIRISGRALTFSQIRHLQQAPAVFFFCHNRTNRKSPPQEAEGFCLPETAMPVTALPPAADPFFLYRAAADAGTPARRHPPPAALPHGTAAVP